MEVRTDAKVDPKKIFPKVKHIIRYAFSVGDRHFFQFDDMFNNGCQRALHAIIAYDEVTKNCNAEFLDYGLTAARNCLQLKVNEHSQLEMRASDAAQILKIMHERLRMPKHPELIYKLCSIIFFDQEENPEIYERKYNIEKIAFWKEVPDLESFFSLVPIRNLIPAIPSPGADLNYWSDLMENITNQQLNYFQSFLSPEQTRQIASLPRY